MLTGEEDVIHNNGDEALLNWKGCFIYAFNLDDIEKLL